MRPRFARNLPASWREVEKFCQALSEPVRQSIVMMFDPGENLRGLDIKKQFPDMTRAAVSHHIRILDAADILGSVRAGKEIIYYVNQKKVSKMLSIMAGGLIKPMTISKGDINVKPK